MNLELLESFGQNYPEENDGTLDCITMAIICQFNRFGTLLAVGCNDGRVVIWDFLTRGIAKTIQAHIHPVCSISWSRNGCLLASASTDNNVCVWIVLSGECEHKFRFPSPVLKVQFNPRNIQQILVCPLRHAAVVVTLPDGKPHILKLEDENDTQVVATYDNRGKYIFTGNSKGKILIFLSETFELVSQFRISGQSSTSATAVKSIEFSRRGNSFLVNSADRVIRIYKTSDAFNLKDGKDPEPEQKLQDLVNKTMWKKCVFSGDGEYVCAGSSRQHSLYIWEKYVGNLVKILHGPKGECLLDVVWHPVRPIVASISQGVVTVWAQQQVENWSAFAPDFKELDENVDYEERESEFDLEDEDKSVDKDNTDRVEDDIDEIDVDGHVPIPAFCSSDEDENEGYPFCKDVLMYLPIAPEVEDPEEHFVSGMDTPSEGSPIKRGNSASPLVLPAPPSNALDKNWSQTIDISLEKAPLDEVHPLLSKSASAKEKSGSSNKRPTAGGRSKAREKTRGK